ncbi:LppX_LprAFG lipoprotein [Streptomyces sp. UNOC14_S4]|uniref:LppX_LprAFG lipoprotein n=1 Tax=Streptomyces sp. UNOC14_S4 TaxID=2872340 RepID=UPI001E56BCD4|nr:LppX_LprAFG lipoprotein [Streptomyces sp. UNOC14_S4]MCC3768183.1 LppX_LprAFG lipoprotein [Streptomyces sp. UNOC14_S4]
MAIQDAVEATAKSSARIDEQVEWSDGTRGFTVSVKGGLDFADGRGRLKATIPGQSSLAPVDEVFSKGTVYLKMAVYVTDDPAWWSVPRDKAEAHFVLRSPLNDPEHLLRQVARMRKPTKAGEEKVNGIPAVHYRGWLDHETLTLRMAKGSRDDLNLVRSAMSGDIPVPAEVWIDRSGRVVRARATLTMKPGKATTTLDLTDHGAPVETPTAPEGAKALPLEALDGRLMG